MDAKEVQPAENNKNITHRKMMAWGSGCFFAVVFMWLLKQYWNIFWSDSSAVWGSMKLNDLTEKAIEVRLSLSKTFFQLAIIFLGALWGLILAKEGEARLVSKDRPELYSFIFANCLLSLSLLAHHLYFSAIASSYYLAGILLEPGDKTPEMPDVINSSISYLLTCQIGSLIAGIIIALLTMLSVHRLRS